MVHYLGTDAVVFLEATLPVVGFACVSIVLVIGATIGTSGIPLTVIILCVIGFGYLGQFAPSLVTVPDVNLTSYITYLTYGSDGLFGRPLEIFAGLVLAYVIFGSFFEVAGGSRAIEAVALRIARKSRASAIKACVVASGMFGMVSGAAISNVLTSGAFSIPSMRRIGVKPETAAGIEAAASSCGQIMPPVLGAAAFFLADLAGVSYGTVAIAAIGPAALCYFTFFRQANLVPLGAESSEPDVAGPKPFGRIWLLHLIPPAVIVALLLYSEVFVSIAAIAGIFACICVSLLIQGFRQSVAVLNAKLPDLIKTSVQLLVASAAIGLLLGALNSTGLTIAGAIMISRLGEGSLMIALGLTAVSAFVLGMGVATVGVYIVSATLLTPGLIELGVPVLAAHFFVLYCGLLSLLTPPVAFASLAASALANTSFSKTSHEAMRFGWVLFLMPFLIVFRPGLLLLGGFQIVAVDFFVSFSLLLVATTDRLARVAKGALLSICIAAVGWPGTQWLAVLLSLMALLVLTVKSLKTNERPVDSLSNR